MDLPPTSHTVEPIPPPPPALPALPTSLRLGARWRRALAFSVDLALLGIVSGLICIPFFNALSGIGAWGRLIGLAVVLAYFGYFDSVHGAGQSLGKRLFRVQVVDASGNPLRLERILLRTAIFAIPLLVNQLPVPISRTPVYVETLLGLVIFGVGGAMAYLMLFNRRPRPGSARSRRWQLRYRGRPDSVCPGDPCQAADLADTLDHSGIIRPTQHYRLHCVCSPSDALGQLS